MNKKEKAEGYEFFARHMEYVGENVNIDLTDAVQDQKAMLLTNKRYDFLGIERYKAKMFRRSDGSQPPIELTMGLVGILDVTCKYRPHMKMGDFWLAVMPKGNNLFEYKFYHRRLNLDNTYSWEYAYHPHISTTGSPCLGAFNTGMTTSLINKNIVSFLSNVRSYLEAYNGHSVYQRGKYYSKRHKPYRMIGNEYFEQEYGTQKSLDIQAIERDPSRWGFPGEYAAFGTYTMVGQERCSFNRAVNGNWMESTYSSNSIKLSHPIEFLDEKLLVEGTNWFNSSANSGHFTEFYTGYVLWVKALLDVTILQAQDGVNKLFNNLFAQYRGITDVAEEKALKDVYMDWQQIFYGPKTKHWAIDFGKSLELTRNRFHSGRGTSSHVYVKIDEDLFNQVREKWPEIERRFGGGSNKGKRFCDDLPIPALIGNKMASVIKSGNFNNVKYNTFCNGEVQESDAENILFLADKLRDNVLAAYLDKLRKEEKRCINEWKEIRPDVQPNVTSKPGQQATLFS